MTPQEIRDRMKVWFELGTAKTAKDRTKEQRGWDKAVMTCAEYVRRRQNYDEKLYTEPALNDGDQP